MPGNLPDSRPEEHRTLATCVTCGDELHPERAERYDYCTRAACRRENAEGLPIVAIGVNKASDQFAILDERTREEASSGRYKKHPDASGAAERPARPARAGEPGAVRELVPHSSVRPSRPRWSPAQKRLADIYRAMGLTRDQIANKLGVSPYLVSQILAAGRGPR
jgi:hypothetical protein